MKNILLSFFLILLLIGCNKKQKEQTNTDAPIQSAANTFRPANIQEEMIYSRALTAAVWSMPVVNYQLMYQEMATKLKGDFNQIVIWPKLLDWKNQTLTPNPDVIYLMPFFNTKDVGPIVLEIPPADKGVLNGSVMNYWQAAIEDVGPGGVDKGKGGKYLFLPPDYDVNKVPKGYIPLASNTYQGYALIRSVLKSGSAVDVIAAIEYSKRIKLYPLSQASQSPQTTFLDASNVVYDSSIPYDIRFFKSLNLMVQAEPWLERDKAMIDLLKTIGIERGKPFNPKPRTVEILNHAIKAAKAWLDVNYESMPRYYIDAHWFFPATEETHQSIINDFKVPDSYPVDNRAVIYTMAFFSAKHIGESQYYLMTLKDIDEKPLEGSKHYKLNVPANAPVSQYWSMTVYNRDTHTFIRNAKWMGRSSQTPGIKTNDDGSVDIYFGPTPPPSGESNWIPTDSKGQFEVLARFYGPKKALYDKSWKLGDIEEVN
ncbi:hypothetical protein FEDK69T_25780 [Flavobacterium enshiense DK69]|uniref:DUF1214 domain-containing protein n=1 Tax=Flavobacterium enshiense TaxID=1341165 RepID=UPI0003C59315|nr:DUF1254 domain-containing protein [Flavobacterium enshiense]ESU21211.1 hypothetical protein FEDK69T_25780 [Flavobacterium enshiense DK69]